MQAMSYDDTYVPFSSHAKTVCRSVAQSESHRSRAVSAVPPAPPARAAPSRGRDAGTSRPPVSARPTGVGKISSPSLLSSIGSRE